MPETLFFPGAIENSSLVDKVESKLVELLQQRKLRPGDSIPKETDLAEHLGVSRTVVRESLMRLRMMGLIETKKKKGSVITSPDIFGNLDKSMNPHILSEDTLREIFEIRLVLEVGMADLLYRNKTKEDIAFLKEIVKENPKMVSTIFEIDHEIKFHGKLYEISGNSTLKKFQKMLLPIFDYVHKGGMLGKVQASEKFISHADLVKILEKGTPSKFREGMRLHLDAHFNRLLIS